MINYLPQINLLLAISIVAIQILSVLLIILFVFSKENKILDFTKKNFAALGFAISLAAALSSLFYSDVIGFIPCSLCWLQRIFMYPMVFLFGVAWLRKDRGVIKYAMPILLVGTLISLYHNYIYYLGDGTAPCDASGVSCVQILVSEFGGYVTIPSMALTTFLSLIVLLSVSYFYKKEA